MTPSGRRHGEACAHARYVCTRAQSAVPHVTSKTKGTWSADEHDRFLQGMEKCPMGPWIAIAKIVGTRSVRQVHSHAQKYAAKVERHERGRGKMNRSPQDDDKYKYKHTGHRVVTKITGKFVNRVADKGNHDEDTGKTPAVWTGLLAESPRKVHGSSSNSPISVRGFRDKPSSLSYDPSLLHPPHFAISRHSTTDAPTFDESLDFLINRFLLPEDASAAVELFRPPVEFRH